MSIVAAKALPALSGESLTYNAEKNLYLTTGYTSMAGNTYFRAIRFSPRLAVYYNIGVGYAYTFLNGLHIYDLVTKKLLCERYFNCHFYSKDTVRQDVKRMLEDLILESAQKERRLLNAGEVRSRIASIVDKAFSTNQAEMLQNQMRALGF